MDAIRTIIFFIPLIFHCECTKRLCSNSTGICSGMSKGVRQDFVGGRNDSVQGNIQFNIVV